MSYAASDVFSDVSSKEDLTYVEPSKEYKELCTAYNQNKETLSSTFLFSILVNAKLPMVMYSGVFSDSYTMLVYFSQRFSSLSDKC